MTGSEAVAAPSPAAHGGHGAHGAAGAVGVLAATAFLVVTAETLPIGLQLEISRGLHAPPSQVGLLVTFYAVVAAVTSIPAIRWTADHDRRTVVTWAVVAYAASNLAGALAPNLATLFATRGAAAVAHGMFFAIASPAAARVSPAERTAHAVSRIALGTSVAFVVGVPLATAFGQWAGWRESMAVVGCVALALGLGLRRLLPPLPAHASADDAQDGSGRSDDTVGSALRSRGLQLIYGVTALMVTAHFASFTYLSPYLVDEIGLPDSRISWVLGVYGTAAVVGSIAGGRLADRHPQATLISGMALLVTGLLLVRLAVGPAWVTYAGVTLWGVGLSVSAFVGFLSSLRRGRGRGVETITALHSLMFQVGIVTGSGLGSIVVSHGHLRSIPLGSAATATVALVVATAGRSAFAGRRSENSRAT